MPTKKAAASPPIGRGMGSNIISHRPLKRSWKLEVGVPRPIFPCISVQGSLFSRDGIDFQGVLPVLSSVFFERSFIPYVWNNPNLPAGGDIFRKWIIFTLD